MKWCYVNTLKLVFKTGLLDVSNINLPSKFGVCMIPKSDPWWGIRKLVGVPPTPTCSLIYELRGTTRSLQVIRISITAVMSRFFSLTLFGFILTAFFSVQNNYNKNSIYDTNSNSSYNNSLVHRCVLATYVSNKRSKSKTLERLHHSQAHDVVLLLLLCSGDIASNPGPATTMKATEFSKKLKRSKRVLLSRLICTQKK